MSHQGRAALGRGRTRNTAQAGPGQAGPPVSTPHISMASLHTLTHAQSALISYQALVQSQSKMKN